MLIAGNAAPRCYDEENDEFVTSTWMLGARVNNNSGILFGNGFEYSVQHVTANAVIASPKGAAISCLRCGPGQD